MGDNYYQAKRFIDFVIATGYKDEPLVDKDGKPRLRRTTPVHLAARRWFVNRDQIIRELFKIYQANYIDENGQTHFHVACSYGFDDIVEKFLDLGQDPNCVTEKTGDSPLHLALSYFNVGLVKLLLRRGANPNLANAQGLTPLHILCARDDVDNDLLETFFKMCDDEHQTLKVNAKDKLGNTPLCTTLKSKNEKVAEFLLRRGSDPNLADESGSTALHIICKSNIFFYNEEFLSQKFFKIIDENKQAVHIDAKDNLGRTPLQWAVANVMPHAVDVLLKRGADLSNFTFPTTNYFAKRYDCSYDVSFYGRFIYTSKTLAIVERLGGAGFELDQDVTLRIAKFFAKHKMFQEKNLEKSWFDHESFASRAKKITIKKNLSLHELIQLEPKQAAKLVTPKDYAKLATSRKFVNISEQYREVCDEHLCEKVARGFFRRLALYPFWEKVIWYRLPLECCEMILENLTNRDLCNIYLAANMSDGDSSSNKWVALDFIVSRAVSPTPRTAISVRSLGACSSTVSHFVILALVFFLQATMDYLVNTALVSAASCILSSTAGSVSVRNGKKEVLRKRVKGHRYVSGKRTDDARCSSDEESDEDDFLDKLHPVEKDQDMLDLEMYKVHTKDNTGDPRLRRLTRIERSMEHLEVERVKRRKHIAETEVYFQQEVMETSEEMIEMESSDTSDDEDLSKDEIKSGPKLTEITQHENGNRSIEQPCAEQDERKKGTLEKSLQNDQDFKKPQKRADILATFYIFYYKYTSTWMHRSGSFLAMRMTYSYVNSSQICTDYALAMFFLDTSE
ncbi:unnamed protein product [Trichogramma brassicae]|uniref:Uncharacterized protein n=1 Tax=Trichogramma brassicae TaxID=86971 RepID=A0A6H5IZI3_9HYME|nr:unnamed protein product [Trichogramma brassicae]